MPHAHRVPARLVKEHRAVAAGAVRHAQRHAQAAVEPRDLAPTQEVKVLRAAPRGSQARWRTLRSLPAPAGTAQRGPHHPQCNTLRWNQAPHFRVPVFTRMRPAVLRSDSAAADQARGARCARLLCDQTYSPPERGGALCGRRACFDRASSSLGICRVTWARTAGAGCMRPMHPCARTANGTAQGHVENVTEMKF